ncbi:MAG: Spy/CpxP family protein refolding chaperone [Planctomycetota bacterium]|nr:Spy/CpxP family protein refolding chaperone [Planctomycetota bacterium]
MATRNWTLTVARSASLAAVMFAGTSFAMAEDAKVLAGPKPGAPTTQPRENGFGKDRHPAGEFMHDTLKDLNLTPDQETKVKAIFAEAKTKHEAWRTAHGAEADALKAQVKAAREAKDEAKLKELRPKVDALMADMPKPKDVVDKVRAVLTPEQQTKFDAKVAAERKEMMEKHPGMGPGMDGEHKRKHDGAGKPDGVSKPADGAKLKL